MYLGDFAEDSTVDFKWSTNDASGASITRATNGTIEVFIGNSESPLTAGVVDSEDFDSDHVGIHHCRVDLSASASYVPGSECQVVLVGATIDGQSVNAVLAHFSIERSGGALALAKALPTALQIADALLNRDMSAVSDTNARSPLNALRFLRNKWGLSGTTLTVRKEDDSTSAWTAEVTASPGADPISGSDPS